MELIITSMKVLTSTPSTSYGEQIRLPVKAQVMGEELVWDITYQIKKISTGFSTCEYGCRFRLASVMHPLRTISYDLDSDFKREQQPPGPLLLNEWYELILDTHKISLKIKLEVSEALEQNQTMRRMYNDQVTSDVEIHCGDLVIKAHQTILGAHSKVLQVAFNKNFVEGQTKIYQIQEKNISPDLLQNVLKWMYMHSIENATEKARVYI